MKPFDKKGLMSVLAAFLLISLTACGTTVKNYTIDSNPKGALVVAQPQEGHASILVNGSLVQRETNLCETPSKVSARLMSDTAKVTLTAEKRGYMSSTYELNKDSAEAIFFDLKKIDGVPAATFKKEDMASGRFFLLPAYVEVTIQSGLGRVVKFEQSPDDSRKVMEELNAALIKNISGTNKQIHQALIDGSMKTDWQNLSLNLNKYLLKLNPNRLQHYSLPPYVTANVEGFKPFIERYGNQPGNEKPYLVYVWNRCITETKGRQIGNLLLSGVGPAVSAVSRSYLYDPAAFLPNTATLVFIYVIDAKTSEVVHIEQRVFPDITNIDALNALAGAMGKFPVIDEKSK
jgi:hypothetical protein